MTMNEYQHEAMRTADTTKSDIELIECGVSWLNSEAGECIAEYINFSEKKQKLDREALLYELGDALWCIAIAATGLGFTLSDVAAHNIGKRKIRFPDGFNAERSVNREKITPQKMFEMVNEMRGAE